MANVDIKTGTALVEIYDGNPQRLNSFLNSITLFFDLVDNANAEATAAIKAAAKNIATRFVKTRLTGAARQAVPENATYEELVAALKEHCSPKITADNILARLQKVKQTSTTEAFCDDVEKLTLELKSVYINNKIPNDVADQMATKKGVESLINGTKNRDTKIILKAGTFSKINDAIQKLMENDVSTDNGNNSTFSSAQVFVASRGNRSRGRGRASYRGRGNYYQENNFHTNQFQRNSRFQNHYSNRGNFQNNRFPNQRGNFTQRGRFTPNMFLAQHNGVAYHPAVQQGIQLPIQQPMQIPQQQHATHLPQGNIHPLGVQLGQHTQ